MAEYKLKLGDAQTFSDVSRAKELLELDETAFESHRKIPQAVKEENYPPPESANFLQKGPSATLHESTPRHIYRRPDPKSRIYYEKKKEVPVLPGVTAQWKEKWYNPSQRKKEENAEIFSEQRKEASRERLVVNGEPVTNYVYPLITTYEDVNPYESIEQYLKDYEDDRETIEDLVLAETTGKKTRHPKREEAKDKEGNVPASGMNQFVLLNLEGEAVSPKQLHRIQRIGNGFLAATVEESNNVKYVERIYLLNREGKKVRETTDESNMFYMDWDAITFRIQKAARQYVASMKKLATHQPPSRASATMYSMLGKERPSHMRKEKLQEEVREARETLEEVTEEAERKLRESAACYRTERIAKFVEENRELLE